MSDGLLTRYYQILPRPKAKFISSEKPSRPRTYKSGNTIYFKQNQTENLFVRVCLEHLACAILHTINVVTGQHSWVLRLRTSCEDGPAWNSEAECPGQYVPQPISKFVILNLQA